MYSLLLFFHSIFRWLVLISLIYTICRGFAGWRGKVQFSKTDNTMRHTTATIAHIQLAIGYVLYFNSPIIQYFRSQYAEASQQPELRFFGLIHICLMTLAIILITVGSSITKRKETDREKFRTMAIWFLLALLIIFTIIPWPFSPFASRPYLRSF